MRYILFFILFVCNATLNLTSVASNHMRKELYENQEQIEVLAGPITAQYNYTPVSCFGGLDGSITFKNPNGATNYEFSVDGGATYKSSPSFTALAAQQYTLVIRDADNSANTNTLATINITQPEQLEAVVSATSETFAGAKDGAIAVSSPKGGSGAYQYSIDGTSWQASEQFPGLGSGIYNVQIRDANATACQISIPKVYVPRLLHADVILSDISCFGSNNGAILISNASGASTIEYSINGGTTWIATGTFNGLKAGDYNVMIRDAVYVSNKLSLGKFTITEPPQLFAIFSNYTTPQCAGDNGSFSINVTGGSPPYSGIGDFELPSGASRTYIITDRMGCTTPLAVAMPDMEKIVATAVVSAPKCFDGNGTITISAAGGTGALKGTGTYNVQAGKAYSFKVTDANGCSSNIISGIMPTSGNSNGIITITSTITEIDFQKQQLGAIDLQVTGGTESYTYQWSNGAVTKNIHDLQNGGTYTVTVTDSNGCSLTKSFTLAIPNYVPVAKVGPDQIVYEGVTVTLDGTASVDANQDALTYIWDAPKGILLSNANSGKPSFLAPEVKRDTIITFTLVVNDGKLNSTPATVKVAIQNVIKVGTTSFESINLAIYPNPTKGIIKIIGLPEKSNPISIYTSEGKLIQKKIWKSISGIIDISNQASGSYFLVINQQTFKIIKE